MERCQLTAGNAERTSLLVEGEEGEEHGAGADQGHPAIQYHGDDQGDLDERGDDQGHPAIQEW